jgi:integration host factor subunit alpha
LTLTKGYVVERIIDRIGFSAKKSSEIVERLLEIMKKNMETGDDILISNFGKFQVKEKSVRKGRNPATGGNLELPARRVVTFKASHGLRDKINGNGKKK